MPVRGNYFCLLMQRLTVINVLLRPMSSKAAAASLTVMRSVGGFSIVRTHPPTNSLGTACTSILQAMVLVARGCCRRGEMYVTLAEEPTAWEVVPSNHVRRQVTIDVTLHQGIQID